ncbi:RING-type E3 ubiquitin transferase [Citrus sinensis]|nr:RING-type E3 ubiquitin transferase [Citrus sinensis]
MDDSCAVCADTLEWVAYGGCGHREVCSTCVARLRFICQDRRCCICKTENNVVFVTKALGDYTRMISDFSVLPTELREGRVGSYWYHEDTQAFFDDVDHYKMIKAMCRLSCSVCDNMEGPNDGSKRRARFRNIEQLKGHLFHRHKLLMCSLCLEGRKIHFRRDHFLCEDEACLAKKFVVFQSEAEMKIPICFRYRRNNEQEHRRGRGRTFHRESSDVNELSMAIQASLETVGADSTSYDPSSSRSLVSDHGDAEDIDTLIQPFESLATTDSELASRYLQALGQNSRTAPLEESSFPPLPMASSSSQQNPRSNSEGLPNSMAAHLRRKNNRNVTVLHAGLGWPSASQRPVLSSNNSTQPRRAANIGSAVSQSSSGSRTVSCKAASAQAQVLAQSTAVSSASSRNSGNIRRITHSASAPNLANGSVEPSVSDFPPVSAMRTDKMPSISQPAPSVENIQAANRSLVERMRAAFEYDEDKYTAFKDITAQYRQGLIDTRKYLEYVKQYGLSHLVLELARLCPDALKQKELIETYNATLQGNNQLDNDWAHISVRAKDTNGSKKSKGKSVATEACKNDKGKSTVANDSNSKHAVANNFLSTVRELQSSFKPSEEDEEVLSKDGYRGAKGKSKPMVDEQLRGQNDLTSAGGGSSQTSVDRGGGGKQRKKTSKFHRVRLGDGSMAALLDLKNSDTGPDPEPLDSRLDGNQNPAEGLPVPVRGVWKRGGGHKLFS